MTPTCIAKKLLRVKIAQGTIAWAWWGLSRSPLLDWVLPAGPRGSRATSAHDAGVRGPLTTRTDCSWLGANTSIILKDLLHTPLLPRVRVVS